jgi:hypothetical protein
MEQLRTKQGTTRHTTSYSRSTVIVRGTRTVVRIPFQIVGYNELFLLAAETNLQ